MARAWHLKSRPTGTPTADTFELVEHALPPLAEGQMRVRNRWLSVDPYMRGRMNDAKSYAPPFALGEPMAGGAVGEVVESRAQGFAAGDKVSHMQGWRDEAVLDAGEATRIPSSSLPDQLYLGHLGLTGMTAYFGLLAVGEAKEGETVFVSGAAGAVGSAVVQIARIKGMTVIGSAGGPEKAALVRALGAHHVIDYKAPGSLVRKLREAAPDGIDVYFDNVGGAHLDAALAAARLNARFAECGMIEGYNKTEPTSLRYLMQIIGARVRIRGFIISDFFDRLGEFQQAMGGWIAEGRMANHETIRQGLEAMPDAFLGLFSGENSGKMLVKL